MSCFNKVSILILNVAFAGSVLAQAVSVPPAKSPAQAMLEQSAKVVSGTGADSGSPPVVVAGSPAKKPTTEAGSTSNSTSSAPQVKVLEGTGGKAVTRTKETPPPPIAAPNSRADGDSLKLGSRLAVAESANPPISSTGLPGLGLPNANASLAKPTVIQAQNGVNEMVVVSSLMPNRIATPFASPNIVDFSPNEYQVVGSDVFVVPKVKDPIGIFIRDDRPDSPTVALTLVPKAIPGVTILVNIDGAYQPRGASSSGKGSEESSADVSSYEGGIRKLMRQVALEKPLSGYTETSINAGVALIGPLRVIPEKQYSGQSSDIYRYKVINLGTESLELSEESFYQKGVKAVAFYPMVRLDQGKSTKVFIMTGKDGGAE